MADRNPIIEGGRENGIGQKKGSCTALGIEETAQEPRLDDLARLR
jgi:hypothetical protein